MDPAHREVVAALDCGTNSTRLLITGSAGPEIRLMRITRLGQGVDATERLDPEAIARTLSVLGDFRGVMDLHKVTRARLVATSAVRDALNRDEFLAAATNVVGVPAELLDGNAEGALAFAGATASLDLPPAAVVVIDIGGGSTEVVSGADGISVISLDLGCVRLTERYLHHDPPNPDELDEVVGLIGSELERAARALPHLATPGLTLVGLAGTVSTLGALSQGLVDYDRDRIHHLILDATAVERWCDRLATEPATERGRRPGMAPGRED
ncbi:MAG: exopolyphosphatase, partial [Actinomycetes bacterium]